MTLLQLGTCNLQLYLLRQPPPQGLRLVHVGFPLRVEGAVILNVKPPQVDTAIGHRAQRSQGYGAPAPHPGQERALRGHRGPGCGIIQGREEAQKTLVVGPTLDTQRALSRRGKHHVEREHLSDAVGQVKADQSRPGENNPIVGAARVQGLAHPGVHVAPQGNDVGIRADQADLGRAAVATGPDGGVCGQVVKGHPVAGNEHIVRVLPWRYRGQDQVLRHVRGQVLEGVHGQIDLPGPQRGFQLLGEKSLAADFRQRFGEFPVTASGEDDDLHHQVRPRLQEQLAHVLCLPTGQRASPGTDAHAFRHRLSSLLVECRAQSLVILQKTTPNYKKAPAGWQMISVMWSDTPT